MLCIQKENIKICSSDSYMMTSLEFFFENSLKNLCGQFKLTRKKLGIHAFSCHMLCTLMNFKIDADKNDAVILITNRRCYRILKGLITYKRNVFFIDIDNPINKVLFKLEKFIKRVADIDENIGYSLKGANAILQGNLLHSYFNGVSPGLIAIKNKLSEKEVSKAKRQLMSAFLVKTTQELHIKHQFYHKASIHYYF